MLELEYRHFLVIYQYLDPLISGAFSVLVVVGDWFSVDKARNFAHGDDPFFFFWLRIRGLVYVLNGFPVDGILYSFVSRLAHR